MILVMSMFACAKSGIEKSEVMTKVAQRPEMVLAICFLKKEIIRK